MNKHKIKIAVSSCLLGEAVRYDGTDKHVKYLTTELAAQYNLISLCPEMAIGMGVPRAPIHRVMKHGKIQVTGIDNPAKDVTQPLLNYAHDVVQQYSDICGYIFKKDSPSCGTKNVKLMNQQGEYERKGPGLYAAAIMAALPALPVIDEEDFMDKKIRDVFISGVVLYAEKQLLKKISLSS